MPHILAFDSGIGGYAIVGALRRLMPDTRITMLADNAFYPYGEVGDAALIDRIEHVIGQAIERLAPDAVVIACNTASTVALAALRARFTTPFIGCVPPIKWAASLSRTRTIGLLATTATVRRAYLADLAQHHAADCTLVAHGARGLADLAEAVFRTLPIDHGLIRHELGALFSQPGGAQIDTVCIGCTHYSFLLDPFRQLSPPGITWLDPAEAVAARAQAVLAMSGRAVSDADPGPGDALFTQTPSLPAELTQALGGFGYRGFSCFDV